jgi:hypothetical protein
MDKLENIINHKDTKTQSNTNFGPLSLKEEKSGKK